MNWTEEQKQAIEIKDKTMLVSAAAGSGKTAVLVERIKQLIMKDNISIDEFLVVTFTNAAASEMREKIVSAIPEQINKIHKANISTFHAFALEAIRRYFHLVDIDPGFKICDDAQRILLQNDAMDRLFQSRFSNKDENFLNFIKIYGSSKNEDAVKAMISEAYNFIQSLPDPFGWLDEKIESLALGEDEFKKGPLFRELISNIDDDLLSALAACESVVEILEDRGIGSLVKAAEADVKMVEGIRDGFTEDFHKGGLSIKSAVFQRFASSKDEKSDYEEIKEDIKQIREEAKAYIKNLKDNFFSKPFNEYIKEINETYDKALVLKDLVVEFYALYSQAKEKKSLMDFADIEHYALKILSDSKAAAEYREKFKYIFIDEYQDSNLVQEAIISKICRDDNVFMVGDVKQSIYKFRLAEPEIFINKYDAFKSGLIANAMKLDLNKNFRSKAPIIQCVNHLFSKIMDKKNAGMDYDEAAALYKGVSYTGDLEHSVEFHLVDDKAVLGEYVDDEINEMKKVEMEAFTAANIIKKSVGTPYFNIKEGKEKQLENRDIVILLRNAAGTGEIYRQALEQEGIPVFMDTGDGYFDTMEVSVFMNLLKVIDNKKQDVPLISAMRSAIWDFSIDELATIRSEHKEGSYFDALKKYIQFGGEDNINTKCKKVLDDLEKWKGLSRFLTLPDFIWRLMEETGYYGYAGALPGGAQRQGNLRALWDKALKYEANKGKGLFGFVNYVEAVKNKKIAIAPVKLLGESDNVVRIMTVHKSKGLEFPMVLVGGLGKMFHGTSAGALSLHKELGLGLRWINEGRQFYRKTLLQNILESKVAREAMAEEIRILYVALTRAMDKLILIGTSRDAEKNIGKMWMDYKGSLAKARSFMDFMIPGLKGNKEIEIYFHDRSSLNLVKSADLRNKDKLKDSMARGFSEEGYAKEIVGQRLDWAYPYEAALFSKSKYSVSELGTAERKKRTPLQATATTKIAIGNAYHKIMEHIPLNADKYTRENIKNHVDSLISRLLLTKEEGEIVNLEKIERFFNSPLGIRMVKAKKVYRETAFNLLSQKDGEEIIVQGVIDCYFQEDGGYVLIDFKSGYMKDTEEGVETLMENYGPQLEFYKKALEQIKGGEVLETYLYSFAIDKAIIV